MTPGRANCVVHLELHTANLPRACAFYTQLFGWRARTIHVSGGSYLVLEVGDRLEGGVVERDVDRPAWRPYVQVADIADATQRARTLGAAITLAAREGPAGWRSAVAPPAGAEVGLWQPKV